MSHLICRKHYTNSVADYEMESVWQYRVTLLHVQTSTLGPLFHAGQQGGRNLISTDWGTMIVNGTAESIPVIMVERSRRPVGTWNKKCQKNRSFDTSRSFLFSFFESKISRGPTDKVLLRYEYMTYEKGKPYHGISIVRKYADPFWISLLSIIKDGFVHAAFIDGEKFEGWL